MRILTRAVVTLLTVFFLTLLTSASVFAADPARWDGSKIIFEGKPHDERKADGTKPPGLNVNQVYFVAGTVGNNGEGTASVIFFDPSVVMASTTTANHTLYRIDGSGNYAGVISGPTDISLIPKALGPSASQAGWAGNSLTYDGMSFSGNATNPRIANGTGPPRLPAGSQYYQSNSGPRNDGTGVLSVIFFPAGTDVRTATVASFAQFAIDGNGQIGGQIGTNRTIDVIPSATANSGSSNSGTIESSCNIEGIGWAVCPTTRFLAWAMDRVFDLLAGYLEVTPLSTDTSSGMYQAWDVVRNIANVAFVIAFLLIIYSQITSIGLSNYSIKKLLPRLIITAVFVNLSYLIVAAAVDLSNIAGYGVQSIFDTLRSNLQIINPNRIVTWESVTGYILTATAATTAGAVAIGGIVISSGASLGAALVLLLPMLLGLIIALLVALVVLAARQALIVILIIIAPLAIVAYLLPNTEKLFSKWRGLFITLLVFFPLFALIFGGSQLAAQIIISSASGENAINIILLAMFVQVAPLVLTPLLIKFSGTIIGRIAGFVNDPGKGLVDRTRTWSKQQSEYMAAKNMARRDPVRPRQVFRRFALGMDEQKRKQDARLAAYKEASDARWSNSSSYSDIQQDMRYNQDLKGLGEGRAELRYDQSRTSNARVRQLDTDSRYTKLRTENAKAQADIQWEANNTTRVAEQRLLSKVRKDTLSRIQTTHDAEYDDLKAGRASSYPATAAVGAMMRQTQDNTRLMAINAMRSESAKRAVNEQLTTDLKANTQRIDGQLLQTYAGGVQGIQGAQRALAAAIAAQDKASAEAQANALTIIGDANLSDSTTTEIALGNRAATSIFITEDIQKAALSKIISGANADEILRIISDLEINGTPENQDIRQIFAEQLLTNPKKPKSASAGQLAGAKQGMIAQPGKARLDEWNALAINAGKFSAAETLVTEDKAYLTSVRDTLRNNLSTVPISPAERAQIRIALASARTNALYSGKIAERREILEDIERYL